VTLSQKSLCDLRLAAAIYWYQRVKFLEKAATIAGLNRRDFIEALAREQVDVFVVDFDDLRFLQPNNAAQFQPRPVLEQLRSSGMYLSDRVIIQHWHSGGIRPSTETVVLQN